MAQRTLELTCADGYRLSARCFEPVGPVRGGVLIVSAMGVKQGFYSAFADWLARQGYLTLTFDYRGIGGSRQGPLAGLRATLDDWATLDCAAALNQLEHELPSQPLFWVGHSLGGQIFGLVPKTDRISKMITVAAGSGYWRENARPLRYVVGWLWFVVAPLAMAATGYFPGRRLRMVGDLPRGVMAQWRRWCLDPEYMVGAEGQATRARFAAVRTPIVSFSFTDDQLMSRQNIDSVHGFYSEAPRKMVYLSPRDVGAKAIGHFGFFRSAFESSLWRDHLLPELH